MIEQALAIPWSVRQRLRHSQSSQSDEYLKTCLKERGGRRACACIGECLCVSRQTPACGSCVRGRLFNITFVCIWCVCVCAGVHVTYMDNVCMYICLRIVHRYVSNTDMCQILCRYITYFTINSELFVFQYIVCLHVFTCKYFVPDHTFAYAYNVKSIA